MAYIIYKTDGTLFLTLEDGQIDNATTSLTLVGKNVINYGQYENTNLIKLLENFSNITAPPNPVTGQTWYDKSNDALRLKVYNGTNWSSIPKLISTSSYTDINSATSFITVGDFVWDTVRENLYVQSNTGTIQIGGLTSVAPAAQRLSSIRNINGVGFDGTSDIAIFSATPYYLRFGNFLLGGNFNGSSEVTLNVDTGIVNESIPSKIVARDSNGDIWFRVGFGTATASRYADLAEKYIPDMPYEVGTVVMIGGTEEVTACSYGSRAIGAVSENPGFMMNQGLENGIYIALKGRVPIRVQGVVRKGQRLIAGSNGRAVAVTSAHPDIFAIALNDGADNELVEALIL